MRYRIDPVTGQPISQVNEDMLVATAVFGFLVGIGFVIAGVRGRQAWLALWGGSLVLASTTYMGAVAFGFS